MSGSILASMPLILAFWVAFAGYLRRSPNGEGAARHAIGLALGAVAGHAGWIALHADKLSGAAWQSWLLPVGYCVLFVPLGPLLAAPWRRRSPRTEFLGAAFGALPAALAVARVGCLLTGCCHGVAIEFAWGVEAGATKIHPTAAYEIAALLALHATIARAPRDLVAPAVLTGIGAIRLAIEPLRAPPPLGPPLLPIEALAGCLALGGGCWLVLASRRSASGPVQVLRAP